MILDTARKIQRCIGGVMEPSILLKTCQNKKIRNELVAKKYAMSEQRHHMKFLS